MQARELKDFLLNYHEMTNEVKRPIADSIESVNMYNMQQQPDRPECRR